MVTHLVYLVLSIVIVTSVIRTLHRNGRAFLVEMLDGDEVLADTANWLLLVGCYLTKIAYAAFLMRFGGKASTLFEVLEIVATRIGALLLLLGVLHMLVMLSFNWWRTIRRRSSL